MRITNKIMQQNNLANINTNKVYQDTLSNQMSTQKKIIRPSDDPVVAIRALRLRSNVTEISQYYDKNIPDAESWLSVTEDALKNLSQIVTSMITQCTKGANGDLKTSDREIILEQLKALGEEVYSTGDADYAGRYVFTGYRTDTSLKFDKEEKIEYTITEQVDNKSIDSVTNVNLMTNSIVNPLDLNSANYMSLDFTEENITSVEVHRIRLAYNDCSDYSKLSGVKPSVEFTDANGVKQTWTGNDVRVVHSYEDPYSMASTDKDAVLFVPETGEVLLGENRYDALMRTKDDESTIADESEIRITYRKENWQSTDLRPEHYFYCASNPDDEENRIAYNTSYITGKAERQDIEYDVGFNQTIRVNSTADQCFQHGIGREADDLVSAMKNVLDLEGIKATIEDKMQKVEDDSSEKTKLQTQLDAVNKALTLAKDKEQKMFEKGITTFQGYLEDATLCITECGTRSSKLSLIKNRMQNQKTTFETLKSENEDVDITDVAIKLSSAELTYEAALMATGKVSKTTLLNYI